MSLIYRITMARRATSVANAIIGSRHAPRHLFLDLHDNWDGKAETQPNNPRRGLDEEAGRHANPRAQVRPAESKPADVM